MHQDLFNLHFGRLTVIEKTEKNGRKNYWLCKCECGNTTVVETYKLKSGHTQSCGCLHKETFKPETKDLKGRVFGRLTVLKKINKQGNRSRWLCLCECGTEKEVAQTHLVTGKIRSCSCLFRENVHEYRKTHGFRNEKLYAIWCGMKDRCHNPNSSHFSNYGGRGIFVCEEWLNDYSVFREWALNTGYQETLTIDRIDNDKGYSPDNCRWTTYAQQNLNKRTNYKVTFLGKTMCLSEWAKELQIPYKTLRARLKELHWSVEKAFTTKVQKK